MTDQRLPRYRLIQDADIRVKTPLFVIVDKGLRARYLYYPGDRQVTPLRTDDFLGRPIRCYGFGRRANIEGVIPKGTRLRVERIIEGHNREAGLFDEILARRQDATNEHLYHIEFLLTPSKESDVFSRQTLVPKQEYLDIDQ
ncbi:MAG: hypothetical protein FJ224_13155 [Lentisphaerae bacterium]|nr:hypothetical protein [Lentisphaerota bacterium]